jgi:hypothetical protein
MHRLLLAALLLTVAVVLLTGCGGDDEAPPAAPADGLASAGGPEHVHGLGINPADGDLYVATHTGLWRTPAGESRSTRVGDLQHDLMGFTVAGPDDFLASGHPDAREDLPPLMGLQRSEDGGRSWETISLLGEADLHVLRASGERIYGVDATSGRFITSADAGRSFDERPPPAPVFDLAIDPQDPARVVVATERGLFSSTDTGRRWRPLRDDIAGLLAWPAPDRLYLVQGDGTVSRSADGGRQFGRVGTIGTQPEAFTADGAHDLYAAVHGGEVLASGDGGANWQTRSTP